MDEFPHHGHRGPVTQDCPPECLLDVLSRKAWNPLMRGGTLASPPETVGDVLDLHAHGLLKEIEGLGPRRISEIETALVFAGFDLTARRHGGKPCADSPQPGTGTPAGDRDQGADPGSGAR